MKRVKDQYNVVAERKNKLLFFLDQCLCGLTAFYRKHCKCKRGRKKKEKDVFGYGKLWK